MIVKGIGGFYYVLSGETVYECKARGVFRQDGITPLPGDRVDFSVTDKVRNTGNIERINQRDSLLARPAVANVNHAAIVIAVKSPAPDMLLLDKLLVTAEKNGINASVCINKIDLDTQGERFMIGDAYSKAGYRVIYLSSRAGEGLDELKKALEGRITVFAGQSGVGKSTVINMVMDNLLMKTGDLSEKIGRGRHTTRHAELIPLEGSGYIVDTPGFSSFELAGIGTAELQYFFCEFDEFRPGCRFSGCSHISEPGCGVKEAVDSGLLDRNRHGRYAALYGELKQAEDFKYKRGKEREKV